MSTQNYVNDVIDRLAAEVNAPAFAKQAKRTMFLPVELVHDSLAALRWQADEIAQLREDLSGAMGAVVSLTKEIGELNRHISYQEDALTEYAAAELVREQGLDYYLGAR